MAKPPRQPERNDSAEAGGPEKPMTKAEAAKAMSRFKTLTRHLLAVPRERLKVEEIRFRSGKPWGGKGRRRGTEP